MRSNVPTLNECINGRPSWDEVFFSQAVTIAQRSFDTSSQVGVVVVTPDNVPISFGYNNPVRGMDPNEDPHIFDALTRRPDKYAYFEHAERNSLYNALRLGRSVVGATMYLTMFPCPDCARGIVQSGISKLKLLKCTSINRQNSKNYFPDSAAAIRILQAGKVVTQLCDVNVETYSSLRISGEQVNTHENLPDRKSS